MSTMCVLIPFIVHNYVYLCRRDEPQITGEQKQKGLQVLEDKYRHLTRVVTRS